jgi:hypothetical protein
MYLHKSTNILVQTKGKIFFVCVIIGGNNLSYITSQIKYVLEAKKKMFYKDFNSNLET